MANATIASQVQALYVGYLGRAADQDGLDFWTNAIAAGTSTIESVALGFVDSAEYTALYAGKTSEELAAAIYKNVLGRDADADGLAFWVGEIENGTVTADTLLASMLNSLGAVDQQVIGNKVFVANAYTAAAGADYSAAAGAKVLEGVNGTAASVTKALGTLPVSTATLTEGLKALADANVAKNAFLDSLDLNSNGKLDTAKAPAGDGVPLATQETNVGTFATTAEGKLAAVLTAGYTAKEVTTIATGTIEAAVATAFAGASYTAGATDAIQDSVLATEKLKIAADLTDAQEDLTKVTVEIAKVANLQTAVDGYNSAVATAKVTQTSLNSATAALEAAKVAFDAANTTNVTNVTGAAANVVIPSVTYNSATGLFSVVTVTHDIQGDDGTNDIDLFDIAANGTVTLDSTQTDITAAESASLQAALESYLSALKADGDADALIAARLNTVQNTDAGSVSGSALAGVALAYNNAKDNIVAIQKLSADLASAEAAVTAARSGAVELKELNDSIASATKALTDAGFAVAALADTSSVTASAKSDVFTFAAMKAADTTAENATITNFGFAGKDVIDATGYSLGGATGDNAVLEVFFKQVGANTVVTFEESAYGSNASTPETFTITLTGVAAADLVLQDGFIQLA